MAESFALVKELASCRYAMRRGPWDMESPLVGITRGLVIQSGRTIAPDA